MNDFERLMAKCRTLINSAQNIVVTAHTNPDGDAVGSVCALLLSLRASGKNAVGILDEMEDKLYTIPGAELVVDTLPYNFVPDLLICLDCSAKARISLGAADLFHGGIPSINIDHHSTNENFADLNLVKASGANCEHIYVLLNGFFPMNKEIACAIYTGILTDTGCFRHNGTTAQTHMIAGELHWFDIPFSTIAQTHFYTNTAAEAKLLAKAIDNMKIEAGGLLVHTSISLAETVQAGGASNLLGGIVSYMKSIEGCQVALFVYEKENGKIKASLRSIPPVDVAFFCEKLGGGGHKNAAGVDFNEPLVVVRERLAKQLTKLLAGY